MQVVAAPLNVFGGKQSGAMWPHSQMLSLAQEWSALGTSLYSAPLLASPESLNSAGTQGLPLVHLFVETCPERGQRMGFLS